MPNYLEAKLPIPSGLNITVWRCLLADFPDVTLVDYLEFAWLLDYTSGQIPVSTLSNHTKDPSDIAHIGKFIRKELDFKAMLGPFSAWPFVPWVQCSPMMTRPKKNSSDKRIIIDLSFPKGKSVNASIVKDDYLGEKFNFTLPTISTLSERLILTGPHAWIWTADLARAYRQLRVCPLSVPLLGIFLQDKLYLDIAPPFGCRTSVHREDS